MLASGGGKRVSWLREAQLKRWVSAFVAGKAPSMLELCQLRAVRAPRESTGAQAVGSLQYQIADAPGQRSGK